jgi:hypothetical protein
MATPEGKVQAAVLAMLAEREVRGELMFWRQNNTGVWDADRGCYRKPKGVGYRPGVPDIMVVMKGGMAVGFECKAPKGVHSPAQRGFQKSLERMGGKYYLLRSLGDALAALEDCSRYASTSAKA